MNDAFSWAARPSESCAVAVIWYLVARSSWPLGFQLVLSADIWPSTAVPSVVVILTSMSVPLLTVTAAELLMEALSEPSAGLILICASDDFFAAASSTSACEVLPSPPPEVSASLLEHAESTSTPPSSADAATRPLRRLPSVITRFSIVADSRNPEIPRQELSTLRPVRPVPHRSPVWGIPRFRSAAVVRGGRGRSVRPVRRRNPGRWLPPGVTNFPTLRQPTVISSSSGSFSSPSSSSRSHSGESGS